MDSVNPPTTKSRISSSLPPSLAARRRRLEIRRFRFYANIGNEAKSSSEPAQKRTRLSSPPLKLMEATNGWHYDPDSSSGSSTPKQVQPEEQQQQQEEQQQEQQQESEQHPIASSSSSEEAEGRRSSGRRSARCVATDCCPRHGAVFVCGRRREMEDAVSVVPGFMWVPCGSVGGCQCHLLAEDEGVPGPHQPRFSALHFFGVYDGHGGAQVAAFCKENLHSAVMEELRLVEPSQPASEVEAQLKRSMIASFLKVDAQVGGRRSDSSTSNSSSSPSNSPTGGSSITSEAGQESPSSPLTFVAPETSGSTAVVAVLGSNRIIVANCGDSRAVLSRGGRAIPLSRDHKPDQDDELARVEAAGGRVIFWNGYRVLGVLAMSRAIGDRYLKPFIIPEPEVTCTDRSEDDEFLILASDGLWDVLTNEAACEIAKKCLYGKHRSSQSRNGEEVNNAYLAAGILTKFAIAKGSCDNISVVVVDLKKPGHGILK